MAGWASVGAGLAGNEAGNELAFAKGANLGANTQVALAKARESVAQEQARLGLGDLLAAAGVNPELAAAEVGALSAGGKLGDTIALLTGADERSYRQKAADPTVPFEIGNRALMGVASAPVERYASAGEGLLQDKLSAAPPTTTALGDALINQRNAAADASRANASKAENAPTGYKIVQVGNVPHAYYGLGADGNPVMVPLSNVGTVATNVGTIAAGKTQGNATGANAAALPDTLADIAKMRGNIENLIKQPGYASIYGNVQGPLSGVTQYVDQDIANAKAALQQLDAEAFGVSIQKMRGLGQLSNAEGKRVTDAFTAATNPNISEQEATRLWSIVLEELNKAEQRAQQKAQLPDGSPAGTAPAPTGGAAQSPLGVGQAATIGGFTIRRTK